MNDRSICEALAAVAENATGGSSALDFVVTDPVGEWSLAHPSTPSARTRKKYSVSSTSPVTDVLVPADTSRFE